MSQCFKLLEALEQTSSKLAKQELLTTHIKNQELHDLLDAAFNYHRRFFMKKWSTAKVASTPSATHEEFLRLLSRLENRDITGHAALYATEDFFSRCTPDQVKWYTRVIQQDLKIGVSVDTAIKCGFSIPKFEVQLATDGHKCKRLQELLRLGCSASPKLDGYRCIAVINKGEVILYSRNGTVYENFLVIQKTLSEAFPNEQLVLDGEILSDDFNAMQQTAFASKRGTAVGDVKYHVFDLISYKEWTTDQFTTLHKDRIEQLRAVLLPFKNSRYIKQVEHTSVTTLAEIQELERSFIEQGLEGVMINPNIAYYRGRKANCMLKFKTMLSMECRVVDFYEGEIDTRHRGSLGGVIVEQENGQTCRIGSGFSDEERTWIWHNQQQVQNRILEAKYQELTPDGKMRFPTKFRWRTDKDENNVSQN